MSKLQSDRAHPAAALLMALLCHGAFAAGVGGVALATGTQLGLGMLTGTAAAVANGLLLLQWTAFVIAWILVQKALWDLSPGVQSGAAGCWALFRGNAANFGGLPRNSLFRRCCQPIYLGFAMVLWSAPIWLLDWLLLSLVRGAYCVIGPLRNEARWQRLYGDPFSEYRASGPYLLLRLRR